MGTVGTKEIAPLEGEAKANQLVQIQRQYRGDSRESQRIRLLHALRLFPISTLEARKHLDIMHPAGRVQELRESGHEIATLWTCEQTDAGRVHRIGAYALVREERA